MQESLTAATSSGVPVATIRLTGVMACDEMLEELRVRLAALARPVRTR